MPCNILFRSNHYRWWRYRRWSLAETISRPDRGRVALVIGVGFTLHCSHRQLFSVLVINKRYWAQISWFYIRAQAVSQSSVVGDVCVCWQIRTKIRGRCPQRINRRSVSRTVVRAGKRASDAAYWRISWR